MIHYLWQFDAPWWVIPIFFGGIVIVVVAIIGFAYWVDSRLGR